MEYKVGDRFKCISDDLFFFDFGDILQVKKTYNEGPDFCVMHSKGKVVTTMTHSFLKKNFEKVGEDDLRDLLKVGYMFTTDEYKYVISNLYNLHFAKEKRDKNLKGVGVSRDIIAIHKPKYNGVKPMEWELVWKRKEPKYYLRSWVDEWGDILDDVSESEYNYLNFNAISKVLFLSYYGENDFVKTQFTKREINELPHQEFIKTLVKEEVK